MKKQEKFGVPFLFFKNHKFIYDTQRAKMMNTLLGHQRKKIAIELDIKVPCIIRNDLKEEWQIEEQIIKDNLLRRHLSDYQKVQAGKRLEIIEIKKAKERQKLSKGRGKKGVVNLPHLKESNKGKTRDKVAKKLGFSGSQYAKAKVVDEKASPKIKKAWKDQEISTHRAYLETTNKNKGMPEHTRKVLFSSEHDNWAMITTKILEKLKKVKE